MWPFVDNLFHLSEHFQSFSMVWPTHTLFVFIDDISLYECVLLIHSLVDEFAFNFLRNYQTIKLQYTF